MSLRQISTSSSHSNISHASSVLAPDTPRKVPNQPPSPSHPVDASQSTKAPPPITAERRAHQRRSNASDENVSSNLQQPFGEALIEMQDFASEQRAGVPSHLKHTQSRQLHNANGAAENLQQNGMPKAALQAASASENDPLLANSASNVLSEQSTQSADSALQGKMLHDKYEADDAAEQLGMTPSALKVGTRSAVVAMNLSEGPSENATEALEALGAAGYSPKTLDAAADAREALDTAGKADSKGRIMKVGICNTASGTDLWLCTQAKGRTCHYTCIRHSWASCTSGHHMQQLLYRALAWSVHRCCKLMAKACIAVDMLDI